MEGAGARQAYGANPHSDQEQAGSGTARGMAFEIVRDREPRPGAGAPFGCPVRSGYFGRPDHEGQSAPGHAPQERGGAGDAPFPDAGNAPTRHFSNPALRQAGGRSDFSPAGSERIAGSSGQSIALAQALARAEEGT